MCSLQCLLHVAAQLLSLQMTLAGGYCDEKYLDIVEVMNTSTKQWTKISPLPQPLSSLSGAICRDRLYLAGGHIGSVETTDSVLTCSITDLQQPQSFKPVKLVRHVLTKTKLLKEVHSLTVTRSNLATCGSRLLSIGGKDTTVVSRYREDPYFDNWDMVFTNEGKTIAIPDSCSPSKLTRRCGGIRICLHTNGQCRDSRVIAYVHFIYNIIHVSL